MISRSMRKHKKHFIILLHINYPLVPVSRYSCSGRSYHKAHVLLMSYIALYVGSKS